MRFRDRLLVDYISFIAREPNEALKSTELYRDYENWYANLTETINLRERIGKQRESLKKLREKNSKDEKEADKLKEKIRESEQELEKSENDLVRFFYEKVFEVEKDKMLYFFLALPQNVLLIKSNPTTDSDKEKRFLGYKFSDRRGHEGITMYIDANGILTTKLYNEKDNSDTTKVNSYIYRAFLNKQIGEIDESLTENIQLQNLAEMMNFKSVEFEKIISLTGKEHNVIGVFANHPNSIRFDSVATLEYGEGLPEEKRIKGEYPVVGSNGIVGYHNTFLINAPAIIVGRKGSAGKVTVIEKNCFPIDTTFYVKWDESRIHYKFLSLVLSRLNLEKLGGGVGAPGLNRSVVHGLKIPVPPLEVQEKIVREINKIEDKEKGSVEKVDRLNSEIEDLTKQFFAQNNFPQVDIGKVCDVKGGKRIPLGMTFSLAPTEYPYIRVTDFKNHSVDLANLKYISKEVFDRIANYTISSEDVYISIAGTIGLVGIIPHILNGKSLTENAAKIVIHDSNLLLKTYLMYFLASEFGQAQILERVTQVGVPKLALKRIETIKIPLAPIAKQNQLVSQINYLENKIIQFEKDIEAFRVEREQVLQKYL